MKLICFPDKFLGAHPSKSLVAPILTTQEVNLLKIVPNSCALCPTWKFWLYHTTDVYENLPNADAQFVHQKSSQKLGVARNESLVYRKLEWMQINFMSYLYQLHVKNVKTRNSYHSVPLFECGVLNKKNYLLGQMWKFENRSNM